MILPLSSCKRATIVQVETSVSLSPKNAKQLRMSAKNILNIFLDIKVILYKEFIPDVQDETFHSDILNSNYMELCKG